jgi:hypothetical protein
LVDRFDRGTTIHGFYDETRFPMASETVGSLSGVVKKAMRADTERSVTICAIALKRYALRHGKLPASLDSLVPEILSSAPIDYMDGKPMKCHLNAAGTFTL